MYDFEDIEDYLHNSMEPSDRKAFEQALQTDPELAGRLEALRAEPQLNRLLRDDYLLEQFADWENEAENEKTTTPGKGAKSMPFNFWWLISAAAVALTVVITGVIVFGWFRKTDENPDTLQTNPPVLSDSSTIKSPVLSPDTIKALPKNEKTSIPGSNDRAAKIYASLSSGAYIEPDFEQKRMGAAEKGTTDNYSNAVRLYNAGKFAAVLKLLENPNEDQESDYYFLRGYSYYHLGQFALAEKDFRQFRTISFSDHQVDAVWCEVFCLLKQLPASRSRLDTVLQEILAKPQGSYYKRALKLQQELQGL